MKQAWKTTLVVSFSCASTISAQDAVESAPSVAACAAIESADARLGCFDELARRLAGDGEVAAPRPTSSGSTAAAAEHAPSVTTERRSRREVRAADRAERELTSQVAAVRELEPGRIEVTLVNGQVWRQTNSDRYNLLVGHEVRLYPSGFGQYFRLSSKELRSFIQVERVR